MTAPLWGLSSVAWAIGGAILGAIFGSFIAALCLRWPCGDGVTKGRSRCDACGVALGARDLVPLLSALAAHGQCRRCAAPIDPLHARVEALAAAAGFVSLAWSPGFQGLAVAAMGWAMLPLAILDWRHFWLPDRLTLWLAATGLALGGIAFGDTFAWRIVAGLTGFVALWAVAALYRHIRHRDGMGAGDPKLFGAIGLWIGPLALAPTLFLAALVGIMVHFAQRRSHDPGRPARIAFGTMLCVAAIPAALIARRIY